MAPMILQPFLSEIWYKLAQHMVSIKINAVIIKRKNSKLSNHVYLVFSTEVVMA